MDSRGVEAWHVAWPSMAWLALTLRLVDGLKGLREGRSRDVHLWRLRHPLLYLYLVWM